MSPTNEEEDYTQLCTRAATYSVDNVMTPSAKRPKTKKIFLKR